MELEIINYIKQAKDYGLSDFEIKKNLLEAGWEAALVEEHFEHAKAEENKLAESATQNLHYPQPLSPLLKSSQITSLILKSETSKPQPQAQPAVQPGTQKLLDQSGGALDQAFQDSSVQAADTGRFKVPKMVILLAGLGVVVLAAAGYLFYAYAYNSPAKVWNKFLTAVAPKTYENKTSLRYVDGSKLSLSFGSQGYVNLNDPANPETDSNFTLDFPSGGTPISQGVELIIKNNVLYVNTEKSTLLKSLLPQTEGQTAPKWLKLDFSALDSKMKDLGAPSALANQQKNKELSDKLKQLWENAPLIKMEKSLGTEKIGDTKTLHFKNTLDKTAFKNTVSQSVDLILNSAQNQLQNQGQLPLPSENFTAIKTALSGLVDKLEVKELETWVNLNGFNLSKIHLVTSAPSVGSLGASGIAGSVAGQGTAQEKSRDAKRFADVRQMQSALELYFNDHGGYPAANNGQPADITPMYLGSMPTAPQPSDGTCTDYFNSYWYSPTGNQKDINGKTVYASYELTFCLGQATAGFQPGIAKAIPQGIQAGIVCPDTNLDRCAKPLSPAANQNLSEQINQAVNKLEFSAEFSMDAEYSNFGKTKNIEAPPDAVDILEMMQERSQPPVTMPELNQLNTSTPPALK
jgi:hypothetical protein